MGAAPPFTIAEVNVTGLPWQTGFNETAMFIEAGTVVFSTIKIGFELTGPVVQVRLEVNMQDIKSPFTGT